MFCWLTAILITAALAFAAYKFLIVGGQQALEKDNAERIRLAEERKKKRIAENGYDPLAPSAGVIGAESSSLVDPVVHVVTPHEDASIPLANPDASPSDTSDDNDRRASGT